MTEKTSVQRFRSQVLENELVWFESYLDYFFHTYFETKPKAKPPLPMLPGDGCEFARFLIENEADYEDRVIIMLALTPHIKPQLLDIFFTKNSDFDRGFSEFGGVQGKKHSGFLPTMESAMSGILTASNLMERKFMMNLNTLMEKSLSD